MGRAQNKHLGAGAAAVSQGSGRRGGWGQKRESYSGVVEDLKACSTEAERHELAQQLMRGGSPRPTGFVDAPEPILLSVPVNAACGVMLRTAPGTAVSVMVGEAPAESGEEPLVVLGVHRGRAVYERLNLEAAKSLAEALIQLHITGGSQHGELGCALSAKRVLLDGGNGCQVELDRDPRGKNQAGHLGWHLLRACAVARGLAAADAAGAPAAA